MYLKTEIVASTMERRSKLGKTFKQTRNKKVCHFSCDTCNQVFQRDQGKINVKRLSNEFKHFCQNCFDSGNCARLGHATRLETLEERIGEKTIDSEGYVRVYVGPKSSAKRIYQFHNDYCGSIREHTLVMESHLGRGVETGECVHHIDGNKTNNKLSNLQLMTIQDHNACHASNDKLVMEMFAKGIIGYSRKKKKYFLKIDNLNTIPSD